MKRTSPMTFLIALGTVTTGGAFLSPSPPTAFAIGKWDRTFQRYSVLGNRVLEGSFLRARPWDCGEGDRYWEPCRQTTDYVSEWWQWTFTYDPSSGADWAQYKATYFDSNGKPVSPANHLYGDDLDSWYVQRCHGAGFVHALTNSAALPGERRRQSREEIITPAKETLAILNFPLVTDGTNNFLYDLRTHRKWKTTLSAKDVRPARGGPLPARGLRRAVCVRKEGKWGLSGYDGTEILPCVYDEVEPVDPLGSRDIDAYIIRKDGETGVCRPDGSWIVPVGDFSDFETIPKLFPKTDLFLRGTTRDGKVGIVRCADGVWVISPKYEDVLTPGATAAICRKKGLWGVVSFSGVLNTSFLYTSAEMPYGIWSDKVKGWKVTLPGGWERFVTEFGDSCDFFEFGEGAFSVGDAILCTKGRHVFDIARPNDGVRFPRGTIASPLAVSASTNVLIKVKRGGRIIDERGCVQHVPVLYGLYDYTHRREVAPPMYGKISVNENMVVAHNAERTDIFSFDGELLLSLSSRAQLPENYHGGFYEIRSKTNFTFIAGIGPIRDGNRAGLIDTNGVLRLPMDYEDMGTYHEGVAPAKRDGLWGYVDLDGNWAIPPKYEAAEAFVNGHAAVRLEGKVGIVTPADEVAAPFVYEEAGYVYKGMFPAKVGGKWGVFGLDGETKLPPEYSFVEWIDIRDPRVPTRFHGRCDLMLE